MEAYAYSPALAKFRVADPGAASGDDVVALRHHFSIPRAGAPPGEWTLGRQVYGREPWAIYETADAWFYVGALPPNLESRQFAVARFDKRHTSGDIYVASEEVVRSGATSSLTLFPTDQIVFARILADRRACYLHAAGFVLDGKGFAFLGHSGAGKSTMVTMLKDQVPTATNGADGILCDDRVVVRAWPDGFRVHGTWSHGDVDEVSPGSAPLAALLVLEQAQTNSLSAALTTREALRTLPQFVVRPLVTSDWWEKTLGLIGDLAANVPVRRLQFDMSGGVEEILRTAL